MAQTIPITKGQFLVTLKGIDSYWQTFSGLSDEAQVSEYSDGLSNRNYSLVSSRKLAQMTLTKAFDPVVDGAVVDYYRNFCDGEDVAQTVTIAPVKYCPNPEQIGKVLTLYGVKPVALKGFEADKTNTDVSMLELTIIADDYEYR